MRPFDDISRLERAQVLDRPAAVVRDAVQRVLRRRRLADALHGVWLGHPLHPGLAQVALGSFLGAGLIDAVRGGRRESTGLLAVGVAAAVPTAASGWADWSVAHEDQQRVGLVHAAVNGAAVACCAAALVVRSRGGSGRLLSVAGALISSVGGLLGGHMSFRLALGANHAEDVAHIGPEDWTDLGPLDGVPEDEPVRREAGAVAVLVVRRGGRATVLADRCPHLSAPLSDGELDGDTIVCPWHASAFRLDDGCVVHGPATAPVPRFESRVSPDGMLQARVVTLPGVPAS